MRSNDLDLLDRHSRRELRDFLCATRGPNATFTREWIAGHGVLPFTVADVVRRCILIAFPIISLWLPSLMR